MRIGIYSAQLHRWGDRRYHMLKEAGFDAVDLRICESTGKLAEIPESDFMATVMHHQAMAEGAGLDVFQMHAPWTWPLPDNREDFDVRLKTTKLTILGAEALGCRYVVVHPLMAFGRDEESGKERETWEANLRLMGELAPYAGDHGVTICLENMPFRRFSMSLPDATYRFVKEFGDERVKICLDTGHCSKLGLKPGAVLREIGDEVRTFHVHDNDGEHDLHQLPYFGVIDWDDFRSALCETGFQGTMCLESGGPNPSMELPLAEAMFRFDAAIARSIAGE